MDISAFTAALDRNETPPQTFVLTPKKSGSSCCSYRKVLEISAAIFACSAIALTVAGLMMYYPTVSTVFFTTFGITAGLSAVSITTFSYMLIRNHQNSKPKPKLHPQED
ncbi:MAG: hypothetical protein K940chlam2_01533 [Chlamydiae bacterium]|nr:hypothetical protein [Chlamydiota bacterium]